MEGTRGLERLATGQRRVWLFRAGLALMASSYLVYPAYAAIPMLDLSVHESFAAAGIGWVASWVVFVIGGTLAGPEGAERLRRFVARHRARSS